MHTQCKFASKFTFFRDKVARLDKLAINTLYIKRRQGEAVDSAIAHAFAAYEYAMPKRYSYCQDTLPGLPDLANKIKLILDQNSRDPCLLKTELAELISSVCPMPIDIIQLCGDAVEEMVQYEKFISKANFSCFPDDHININIQLRLVEGKNYLVEIADITFPPDKEERALIKIFGAACDTGIVEGLVKVYEDASELQRVTIFGPGFIYNFHVACVEGHAMIARYLWEVATDKQRNDILTKIENSSFVSACDHGRIDVVQFLWEIITESQRIKLIDKGNGEILLNACNRGYLHLVKFFYHALSVEQKAYKLDFYGACNQHNDHIADFFWQLAPPEEKDKIHEQWHSLFKRACERSPVKMLKFLWGIRKDKKTTFLSAIDGDALFHIVSQTSYDTTKVQLILHLIADEQKYLLMNKMGTELFHKACLNGHLEVAQFFLTNALPEQRSKMLLMQDSLIFREVCKVNGLIRIVKFLWDQATDIERNSMWDANDHEAFCQACQAGVDNSIKFLWEVTTESQKRAVLLKHSLANFKLLPEQTFPFPSLGQTSCLKFIWLALLANEQDRFKTRSAFSELCEQCPEVVRSQLEDYHEIQLLFIRMLLAYEIDKPQLCVWLKEIGDIIIFRIKRVEHKLQIFDWLLQHDSFQKKMTEFELSTHSLMETWLDVISRIRENVIDMIFKEADSKIFREDKQHYLRASRRHKLFDMSSDNWQQRANDIAIVDSLDTSIERFIKLSSEGNSPSRLTATESFRRLVDNEITLATC